MIVHTNTGVRALESVNELTFTSGLIGKLLKLKSLFRYQMFTRWTILLSGSGLRICFNTYYIFYE